jgi:hypothetical protein
VFLTDRRNLAGIETFFDGKIACFVDETDKVGAGKADGALGELLELGGGQRRLPLARVDRQNVGAGTAVRQPKDELAVEPAGAAALAALMHPLRARLDGKTVGIVVCGANIDPETFCRQLLP